MYVVNMDIIHMTPMNVHATLFSQTNLTNVLTVEKEEKTFGALPTPVTQACIFSPTEDPN